MDRSGHEVGHPGASFVIVLHFHLYLAWRICFVRIQKWNIHNIVQE